MADDRQKAKKALGLKKALESFFDESGRECTACGEYKEWDQFNKHSRSKTGRTSKCKKCKLERRKVDGRNYKREKYCAKKHKANLKKTDPHLVRARNIRASLMNRTRKIKADRSEIPSAESIKDWLLEQEPLTCYYSGKPVKLFDCHIDHKVPFNRMGSSALDNLCVTDPKMNSAKGAMTDTEFEELLKLIRTWEDKGEYLLVRLRMGVFGKRK